MAAAGPKGDPAFGRFRSWPITAARELEPKLKEMGLRVPAARIDGTAARGAEAGKALSDALVSVGAAGRGGTGSFLSQDGLIITNWHVAYDAVRQASLAAGQDHIQQGFVARSQAEELQGPNYECWITQSCVDVSAKVLEVIKSEPDPLKRANRVRDCTQAIAAEAEATAKTSSGTGEGLRCDVQEMFPNETYVLFTYLRLMDVRIVYVPPKALGNFGGDTDNFEWPRHTADFTLLRAYVSPDGLPAKYDANNVPYKPTSWLPVSKSGAKEGDFVFLLGFPGHTMRYAPTSRLRYSDEVAVPQMVQDFGRKLALIAEHETHSAEAALKLGSAKKSLANEYKRSSGKRVVMRKLGLLEERAGEEARLCEAAPGARVLLARLEQIYAELKTDAQVSDTLESLRGIYHGSALLAAGHSIHEHSVEARKPEADRESEFRQRNRQFLVSRLAKRLNEVHAPYETALISAALLRAHAACSEDGASGSAASALREACKLLDGGGVEAVEKSPLKGLSKEALEACFAAHEAGGTCELSKDVFVRVAGCLYETYRAQRDRLRTLLSERDELLAKLLVCQREHSSEAFFPDCNGSLRLSAGRVDGYLAADAVQHRPRTTLAGLLDKAAEAEIREADADKGEFACPKRLKTAVSAAAASGTPVNVLYSTDTVGGNSGSPVLDADGRFVAINFDRQRLGLMNEFKWSPDLSRSIGVDVCYITWLVGEYDRAPGLVEEMLRE